MGKEQKRVLTSLFIDLDSAILATQPLWKNRTKKSVRVEDCTQRLYDFLNDAGLIEVAKEE